MANDEEARWSQITIRQSVDELFKYGPSIEIGILALPADGSEPIRVYSQIDTGAGGTAISTRLARRLNVKPIASGEAHQAGQPPILVPYFKVRLLLAPLDVELDVALLPTLDPPHDVLLGRDLLAETRFGVDFTTGVTRIQFRNP